MITDIWQKAKASNPSGNCLEVRNGWTKAERSGAAGHCVEGRYILGSGVEVRNSRHPDGATLLFTDDEWLAFLDGAKGGEFDLPASRN